MCVFSFFRFFVFFFFLFFCFFLCDVYPTIYILASGCDGGGSCDNHCSPRPRSTFLERREERTPGRRERLRVHHTPHHRKNQPKRRLGGGGGEREKDSVFRVAVRESEIWVFSLLSKFLIYVNRDDDRLRGLEMLRCRNPRRGSSFLYI